MGKDGNFLSCKKLLPFEKNSKIFWFFTHLFVTLRTSNGLVSMKYPIGIQNFEKIRREGYVYVDKTPWMWKMISIAPAR